MRKSVVRLQVQICLLAILIVPASNPVFAAIPLITDDTGTQGKGKFQLEVAGELGHDKEEPVTNRNSDLAAALTYGATETVDMVLAIPYSSWRSDDSGSVTRESGFSDLSVEAKWRFYEEKGLSLAVKPGLTIPTGDSDRDLGNGKMTWYLYLIASKEVNPWAFHLNLAYIRNNNTGDDRDDLWHASLATTVDVAKGLKIVGDLGVATNPEGSSDTPPAYVLGGVIYSVSENFDAGLGLKAGLTKPEADVAVRGGITYRF
ncbi:MAG: transporter [Nitrospiraceae bacterium]|nr:transporter [Nitrospiraceae bacterium]